MFTRAKALFIIWLIIVSWSPDVALAGEDKAKRWYAYVYGGKMITDDFPSIFLDGFSLDYVDSKLAAIGIGKELYHYESITIEGEGQIAQHFGEINEHTEFNALANYKMAGISLG